MAVRWTSRWRASGGRAAAPRALARRRPRCGCAGLFRPAGGTAGRGRSGVAPPAPAAGPLARPAPAAGGLGCSALAAAGLAASPSPPGRPARQPPALELPRTADHASAAGWWRWTCCRKGRRVMLDAAAAGWRRAAGAQHPHPAEARRTRRGRRRATRLAVRALLRPPLPPAYPGGFDFQRASWFSGPRRPAATRWGRRSSPPGEAAAAGLRRAAGRIEARVTAALPGAGRGGRRALLTGGQTAIAGADLAAHAGFRAGAPAQRLRPAHRHRHGPRLRRAALAAGAGCPGWRCGCRCKALAAVAALALGGAYTAAQRVAGADAAELRHGGAGHPGAAGGAAGADACGRWRWRRRRCCWCSRRRSLGASFQMTFAAVLALIAGWEALRPHVRAPAGAGRTGGGALLLAGFGLVVTSLLAGAATTPFGLHHFGRLQLYGVAGQCGRGAAHLLPGHAGGDAGGVADAASGWRGWRWRPWAGGWRRSSAWRMWSRGLAGGGALGAADPGLGARALRLRAGLALPLADRLAAGGGAAAGAGLSPARRWTGRRTCWSRRDGRLIGHPRRRTGCSPQRLSGRLRRMTRDDWRRL